LLTEYLRKFKLHFVYTEEEIKHWFIPRENVIYTYVVEEEDENKKTVITDMISFYSLPSTILDHPEHSLLKVTKYINNSLLILIIMYLPKPHLLISC
jgi:glycylpeptide N-tetradecanoyltransferase